MTKIKWVILAVVTLGLYALVKKKQDMSLCMSEEWVQEYEWRSGKTHYEE